MTVAGDSINAAPAGLVKQSVTVEGGVPESSLAASATAEVALSASVPGEASNEDSANGQSAKAADTKDSARPLVASPATRLAPAPVPASNPWGAPRTETAKTLAPFNVANGGAASTRATPANSASTDTGYTLPNGTSATLAMTGTRVATHSSARRYEELKTERREPAKQRTTGKEKWMPYTPLVTTTPPTGSPSSSGANGSSQRAHHSGSSNHAGNNASANASHNKKQRKQNTGRRNGPNGNAKVTIMHSNPSGEPSHTTSGSTRSNSVDGTPTTGSPLSAAESANGAVQNEGTSRPGSSNHASGSSQNHGHKRKNGQKEGGVYGSRLPQTITNAFDMNLNLLVQQMEYYFSIENMCKDLFLRRQMNSKGLIPITVLATFNRVRTLSGGNIALVEQALKLSPSAEVVSDKVRLRKGWENWVLPASERADSGLTDEEDAPKFQIDTAVPFVPKAKSAN